MKKTKTSTGKAMLATTPSQCSYSSKRKLKLSRKDNLTMSEARVSLCKGSMSGTSLLRQSVNACTLRQNNSKVVWRRASSHFPGATRLALHLCRVGMKTQRVPTETLVLNEKIKNWRKRIICLLGILIVLSLAQNLRKDWSNYFMTWQARLSCTFIESKTQTSQLS